jgi:hypothetical protein
MMRAFIILLALFLVVRSTSCAQNATDGERQYYDSANFSIIKGKYLTGERFLECYQNKLTKLDSCKEYYKNGRLKEEGIMTTGNDIYIGKWKYYSPSGKIDSIINHDNKQPISYFKALRIAKTKGFQMPDMEVTQTTYQRKEYWQISRWTEKSDRSGQTAETILIDKQTGKIIKPDYKLESTY